MEPGVPSVFAVNVLAPYILTAVIERPKRLVYVSSGMHRGVHPRMDDLLWTKRSWRARQLTPKASCTMYCWHLRSLAVGKTSNPTRWNPDGSRQKWAALRLRTIFTRDVSPRLGSPRARTSWRDPRVGISITNALVRRTQSRQTLGLGKICSPSAPASRAYLSIDPCTRMAVARIAASRRIWLISSRRPLGAIFRVLAGSQATRWFSA